MTKDLDDIKIRNARVEGDKAWETSWTRRVVIAVGTYVVISAYLTYLEVSDAWLHALVPPVAYMLSTLSLPFVKYFRLYNVYKRPK